ncbi:hypothetical protein QBC34DRAFT_441760 [Podospora aff. communis PSN243]|uniref:Uncharacterized protein n=1 Tax=Podospora aff. communis PSN243 TaxID=3040156 RepID=A0AAV9GBN3_9PEZI|nr:hypothetical protein QBC34DRAFT_441760 [Podospora aff. communis PSN243]
MTLEVWRRVGWQLVLLLLSSTLFVAIVLVVQLTVWAEQQSDQGLPLDDRLKLDVSVTLAILRVLQGVLSALLTISMARALLFLQWSLICRPEGLSYLSLLSLSGSTGSWGLFRIMFGFGSGLSTRAFAVMGIMLLFLPWLSDLLLYINTTIITVYDTAHSYNATAGVGPFNASLVEPFIKQLNSMSPPDYPYQVLPYSIYAVVYNLMANPWYSTVVDPIACPDPSNRCESYLLSGGTLLMEPTIPPGYESYPLIKVPNVPTVQLDFTPPLAPELTHTFPPSDCDIFDHPTALIAIRLCITPSPSHPNHLNAALFICPNGTTPSPSGPICTPPQTSPLPQTPQPPHILPNLTTTFTLHTRTATLLLSQSNLSITSTSSLSPPLPNPIPTSSLASYRTALSLLLNYSASGIPPPSSIAESFWSASSNAQILRSSGQLSHSFQSILAFPIWLFNANNYGNLETWGHQTGSLPGEFRTTASVVRGYGKIRFDGTMVGVYVVLQGVVLVGLWGLWVGDWRWGGRERGVVVSSFPLFDLVFKARVGGGVEGKEVGGMGDGEVVRLMGGRRVFVKME